MEARDAMEVDVGSGLGAKSEIGAHEVCESLQVLKDENRSLKIKIAGVETLSSLLRGTREELDTVCAEKDSLEIELARLQCKLSLLEKEGRKKEETENKAMAPSKQMFEALLKENKKLKNEVKQAKNGAVSSTESIFGPEAMAELLTFKGELEMEIKNLQRAMISQEGENSISQISRLLGQVTKLEYQLQVKESECESLKTEVEGLKKINANVTKLDEGSNECLENAIAEDDVTEQGKTRVRIDCGTQTFIFGEDATSQTEISTNDGTDISIRQENNNKQIATTENQNASNQHGTSLRRRNSKRASGDWSKIKKVHSDLFEDDWNVDKIKSSEQLKVTQDLLVQANEIIMIMTEENDKLLKVNAMLLQDLAQAEVTQLDGKDKILDRLRFMFTESSFEENNEEIETIQELLLNNDLAYDSDQFYDIKEALWTAHEKQGLKRGLSPEQDIRDHGLKTTGEKATQVGVTQFDERILDANTDKIMTAAQEAITLDEAANESTTNVMQANAEASSEAQDDGQTLKICDSGVEICLVELERHSPDPNDFSAVDESMELLNGEDQIVTLSTEATQTDLVHENCDLKTLLEAQNQKLMDAEEKICELEEALNKFKEAEDRKAKVEQTTLSPNQRLCKSIGHIPSSVQSTTFRRIIFESDV